MTREAVNALPPIAAKLREHRALARKRYLERVRIEQDAERETKKLMRGMKLLERQRVAQECRADLLSYIHFTMPDPEAADDVTKSRYKDAKHHRKIARALEEVERGHIRFLILVCPPRHGKALALDTPVPTPTGWSTMGELKVGDFVFDEKGQPTRVVAKSAVWKNRPVYRVLTDDGDEIIADAKHEWRVRLDRKRPVFKTYTTEALARRYSRSIEGLRAPLVEAQGAIEIPERGLPIDPYVLGVWLGDGHSQGARVTTNDNFIVDELIRLEGEVNDYALKGTTRNVRVGPHYRRVGVTSVETLQHRLRALDLINNKHIPKEYLFASKGQRLALLQGLVDTDGYIANDGQIEFCTIRAPLAQQVKQLVHSLGHKASVIAGRATLKGVDCGPKYRVMFYMDGAARLPRKAIKTRHGMRAFRRYLNFAPAGYADTVCVEVENVSHLFLVGHSMIPTHNSELVSRRFPAWYSGRHPDHDVVVASYSDEFAMDFGAEVRAIVNSAPHHLVFPGYALRRGGTAKDRLQTDKGGLLAFVGKGGALTGRGAHLIVVDDVIKDDKEAMSQAIRDQAWNWLTKVALTRRRGNKLVIITATRWHTDDPIGRLTNPNTDENPYFNEDLATRIKVIELPAIAEENDKLGRQPGEALWPDGPDKFDLDFLAEQKALLGPLNFQALYQGRPTLEEGVLFRRENIGLYNPADLPKELRYYCASDHAVGLKQRNDFTVLLKVGVDENDDIWLTECFWKKAPTDQVVEAMLTMATGKSRPLVWWAESGHISKSIGPFLKKRLVETGKYLNIVEVTPVADKQQRAQSIIARFSMNKVHLPAYAGWTARAIDQMLGFPTATHDDFVDALAYIGLGLQRQYGPERQSRKKVEPIAGSLAFLKANDKWTKETQTAAVSRLF